MKNTSKYRRHYGFRKPTKPKTIEFADGVTRVQHAVTLDKTQYDYAVNIAALRNVSVTYLISTLLKDAVDAEVTRVLNNLK